MEWDPIGTTGIVKNPITSQCLAARGTYLPPVEGVAGVQLWAKPLAKGKVAALFINGGGSNYTANFTLTELNMTGHFPADAMENGATTVTDVWTGEDLYFKR